MKKLLAAVLLSLILLIPKPAFAVVIVQQTQTWTDSLPVWQAIQELGDNLSGTADKFTFRVSTERSNRNQFDYTALLTRIYDKSNKNSYFRGCATQETDPNDGLRGLIFTTENVPAGFQDVTIDFSCRNYTFIPGHKYLIAITNANISNLGSNAILFGASNYSDGETDLFPGGGLRYGNANIWDHANNSGKCDPIAYKWGGTEIRNIGCNVWKTPQDDLYFILTNTSPPPKTPVIFIPGMGGSELKATQDMVWSFDDGHGGTYSHAYLANEKIWVNQDEAVKLGDDDYFDVLRLKQDGVTPEADLSLTGELTSFGYGDIDPFFTGLGYEKNKNFFVFPYDWRKDVRTTQAGLDSLIETARQKTGLSKVNIVAHSMGGLVARNYIADPEKASKINKLIELGVPHLGTTYALKTLMYGTAISYRFKFFEFPVIISTEIKDVIQNLPSHNTLTPSLKYYNFYDDSKSYPFRDDRDIDENKTIGALNYEQTKELLTNLNHNMTVFNTGEQFHNLIDPVLNQPNGVKLYNIVGTAQPTLGQIRETWFITWPVNLIPKTDEIFINGDDTVPLYSASLKSNSLDISGGAKIYYVEQKHSDLVSQNGTAMQTVRKILADDDSFPVEVKSDKYTLDGKHISLDGDIDLDLYDDSGNHTGLNDKGEIETNIPHTFYTTNKKTKHAFVKKKAPKVTVKVRSSAKKNKTNINIRHYQSDSIIKTTTYTSVPVKDTASVIFPVDPTSDTAPEISADNNNIIPSEVTGSNVLDQTAPETSILVSGTKDSGGIYSDPVVITLQGEDMESGVLKIEYSMDNGETVQTYTDPINISTSGKTTIQVKSVDKSGNEEIPQTINIEIASPPSPTATPATGTTNTPSGISSSQPPPAATDYNSPSPAPSDLPSPVILGVSFKNPESIAGKIGASNILKTPGKISKNPAKQKVGGLLIITGGLITAASLGLIFTFIKPSPK